MADDKYDCLKLENQVCFPLYACSKEIINRYRPLLDKLDITYTQYITMMVLWEERSLSVKELGCRLYLDSGTLTPLLKRLDRQGYIRRVRPEDNERKLFLSLTEEGEKLREKAKLVPGQMQGCLPLEWEELVQLKALLDRALKNMDAKN